jgi:hypothetical protein
MIGISMPFKSEKQKKYLYAKKPKLASKWSKKYGSKVKKKK